MCYIRTLRRPTFEFVSRNNVEWLDCTALAHFQWLVHAFSTRLGGVSGGPAKGLNLGFGTSDARVNVEKNRRRFFQALGVEDFELSALKQIHSTSIYQVIADPAGEVHHIPVGNPVPAHLDGQLPVGDAIMTAQPGILLSVRTADCLPVLLVDPRRHAIAALHAGWRGALARIAEKVVGAMRAVFKSDPHRMVAAIGPGIHACCYGVGEEVVAAFHGRFINSDRFFRPAAGDRVPAALVGRDSVPPPSPFLVPRAPQRRPAANLDLVAVVGDQLRAAGLHPTRIHAADYCTACRTDLFFSYRKEGARTGRLMAVIGIKPRGP